MGDERQRGKRFYRSLSAALKREQFGLAEEWEFAHTPALNRLNTRSSGFAQMNFKSLMESAAE